MFMEELRGGGKELFTSMVKEDAIQISDENNAKEGGKGKELEFISMVKEEAIQIDDEEDNANQGGKGKELEFRSMVKEEAIEVDYENNANQEKENSADGEIITEEFTEYSVVKKGKGTPLKDICNVVSKLEEKIHSFSTTLHFILYGEHDEVEDFKKDILEFSGFASDNDEETQRDKVKERLERCSTEMLKQLCYVFDVSAANAPVMSKKKWIEVVLDFLEAPHGSTEETESSDKEDYHTGRGVNLTKQIPNMNEGLRGDATSSSVKITKSVWELEKSNKKKKFTERRVAHGGDREPKEWCDPSYEEIRKAISIILEEMDITIATFSDVLEGLAEHFEMDISPRKDAIMVMIEEELYRLAEETQEQESCQ